MNSDSQDFYQLFKHVLSRDEFEVLIRPLLLEHQRSLLEFEAKVIVQRAELQAALNRNIHAALTSLSDK